MRLHKYDLEASDLAARILFKDKEVKKMVQNYFSL